MESNDMGRTLATVTIENLSDLWDVARGRLPAEQVRRVTVDDALADTGATLLSLPTRLIRELGLTTWSRRRVTTSAGDVDAALYGPVHLIVQGRDCNMDVLEVPDKMPVLIGQLPIEHLDFVVDPRNHKLIGNPAHGGEHMYELY